MLNQKQKLLTTKQDHVAKQLPDLESLFFKDITFDKELLNQVVVEHLLRLNLSETADCFLNESGVQISKEEKTQFEELNKIVYQN